MGCIHYTVAEYSEWTFQLQIYIVSMKPSDVIYKSLHKSLECDFMGVMPTLRKPLSLFHPLLMQGYIGVKGKKFWFSTMIVPSLLLSLLHSKQIYCHFSSLLINLGCIQFTNIITKAACRPPLS